jgi:hypothetical protein
MGELKKSNIKVLILDIIIISNVYTIYFDITHTCINMEWGVTENVTNVTKHQTRFSTR